MSDVRKTVEIALKVVGIDFSKLTSLADTFKKIETSVNTAKTSIDNLQKSLDKVKPPQSLTQVVNSLKQLEKVKIPSLTSLANGFNKISQISPPNLGPFVAELKKFANIKLPGITTLVNSFKKLTELNVNTVINKIRSLNTALAELDKRGGISAFKNFARDVRQMKTAFSAAASSTQKMVNQLKNVGNEAQSSGLKLRTFADKVRTVMQFRLISEALIQIKNSINAGINSIIEYDQALKDLQAITGATSLEVAQMGATILDVASKTKFSASEIATGMRVIGQAGFSASEAIETMQAVSDLATGTLSDMNTTVDLVTTAMRVFQIEASQSAEVADVFANAVNRSKLTIDKLRTAMNYIGPIARDSGVSFKELSASMMTLANSGLRASTIGTGLRRVFAELIDPSKKLKEAARRAGVALGELDPRASSLSNVIQNLGLVVNDAQVAFDVFGKRGASAILALSGSGSKFQEMLETVNRSGIAAKQAAIQMEGLGVSLKNLKDKLGILAIAIGKLGIADAMKIIIDVSRYLVDALTYLTNSVLARFIGKILITSTAVLGLVAAFTALKGLATAKIIVPLIAQIGALTAVTGTATASAVALHAAFLPIIAVIGVISAAALAMHFIFSDGAIKSSESAAILADEYDSLEKKLRDYGKATVNMKKGSEELSNANLELRKELLKVAKGTTEVAEAAAEAASSINPLTGEFIDGKEALKEYNKELNSFQTKTLITALKQATESLNTNVDTLRMFVTRYKEAFSQIGFYAKAWAKSMIDIMKFDYSHIPANWVKAWKDATAKGDEIRKGVDISEALNKGTASIKDLRDAIKLMDMTNLTAQQKQLIESYDAINERAIKYVQHLRDIGKVNLKDSIENIEQLAKDADLVGLNLEAVVEEFKRLKKVNEDTFSNIIEKWEKDADPKFLTRLIEGFNNLGGTISDIDKITLIQIENQRRLRIEQLSALKETIAIAQASGKDMEAFWAEYYKKEQVILKNANEDRKILSQNRNAQNLIAYNQELIDLERHLATIRETWKYNSEERGKQVAKAEAESAKRIQKIITGTDIDPKNQTNAYKLALKQREAAHASFITSINKLEADRIITEETAEKRRLDATLHFYALSLAKAKEYRDQVKKESDPEEYTKRQKVVLSAEKKYYEERGKYLQDYSDLREELEITKLEKSSTISESIYEAALDKQSEAQKTLNTELKKSYDTDVLNIQEYYSKKQEAALKDEEEKKNLIKARIETVKEEYDKRIAAENSVIEQEELRGEKISELTELEAELDAIEQKRIQTSVKLTAAEYKATEAAKAKTDQILEQIRKRAEAAEVVVPGTTIEEKFQIEMEALKRYHSEKYIELQKNTDDEVTLAEARSLQLQEIANKTASHEKKLNDLKLAAQVQFAGDMTSIAKDLIDSGLLRSKEAFKVYQAFAIAESTISTYSAATKAYDAAMDVGGPFASVFAWTAAAAAIVKGMTLVAKISAQTPSYAEGGKIEGYSPNSKSDNIDIKATAGEYMQPVAAVKKYGLRVMNGIRNLSFPKEVLTNLVNGVTSGFSVPIPSFSLAEGGIVPVAPNGKESMPETKKNFYVQMDMTFPGVIDPSTARQVSGALEEEVIKILHKVIR